MSLLKFKDLSMKGKLRFLTLPVATGLTGSMVGSAIGTGVAPKKKDENKYSLRGALAGAVLGTPVGLRVSLKTKSLLGKHLGTTIAEHNQELGSLGGLRAGALNTLQNWRSSVQSEADKLRSLFGGSADVEQAFGKAREIHTPAIESLYRKAVSTSNASLEDATSKIKDFRFGFLSPSITDKLHLEMYSTPLGGKGLDSSIFGRLHPDNPLNILRNQSKDHYRNYFTKSYTKAGLNPDPNEFETLWKAYYNDPSHFKHSVDLRANTRGPAGDFKSFWEEFGKHQNTKDFNFGYSSSVSQKIIDAYKTFGLDRGTVTHKRDVVGIWRKRAAELMQKSQQGDKKAESELRAWNAAYNMIKIDDKSFFDKLAEVLRKIGKVQCPN